MNYIKYHREELIRKFEFRIIILILSLILLIIAFNSIAYSTIANIVSGTAISLLAWAITALADFIIELRHKYIEERILLIKTSDKILNQLDNLIMKYFTNRGLKPREIKNFLNNEENIDFWKDFYVIIKELYKFNWQTSLEQRVYVNFIEFQLIYNYIERCHTLLFAYLETDSKNKNFPVDKFFQLHCKNISLQEAIALLDGKNISLYWKTLEQIELCDQPLDLPDEIISHTNNKAIISPSYEIGNGLSEYCYIECSLIKRYNELIESNLINSYWQIIYEFIKQCYTTEIWTFIYIFQRINAIF